MNFGTQPIFTQLQSAYSRIMRLISTTGQRIWNADDREISYHSIFRKSSSNLVDDGFKMRNLVLERHPCEKKYRLSRQTAVNRLIWDIKRLEVIGSHRSNLTEG